MVLNARLFGDIVRRLPADTVSLSVDKKETALIVSGASEFSITGIPAEEYPDLPSIQEESPVELPQAMLKSMIRQTLFAVAETDAKPVHTGTLFELQDGGAAPDLCRRVPAGCAGKKKSREKKACVLLSPVRRCRKCCACSRKPMRRLPCMWETATFYFPLTGTP